MIQKEEKNVAHDVTITIDADSLDLNGEPTYLMAGSAYDTGQKAKKKKVDKKDPLHFDCKYPYAVQFDRWPFDGDAEILSAVGPTKKLTVKSKLDQTVFKFSVVIFTNAASPPLTADPELEVDPGGGGPG